MASAAAAALLPSLPNIQGPKLGAFLNDIENHNYTILEFLGAGAHSAVLRINIDNVVYVVKFFITPWLDVPTFEMYPLEEQYMKDQEQNYDPTKDDPQSQAVLDVLKDYTTPFYNECRVYGRLKELDRENLAIKAHGYLRVYMTQNFLTQWRNVLARDFANQPQRRWYEPMRILQHNNLAEPVYAIVKDWVQDHRNPDGSPVSNAVKKRQIKRIPKMLRDLHSLHKCGIVVRDLKEQQYYEGQIADFSHAWTVPHYFGPGNDLRPAWVWKSMAAWDLHCFQEDIIDEWTNLARGSRPTIKPPTVVAWRNGETRYPLRGRAVVQGPKLPLVKYDIPGDYEMNYDPPFDQSEFNWKLIEKKKTAQGIVAGRIGKRPAGGQASGGRVKRPRIILKTRGKGNP